jgi:hypothetical protein
MCTCVGGAPQDGNANPGAAINTFNSGIGTATDRIELSTKFCKFDGNQAEQVRASAAPAWRPLEN